MPKKNNNPTHHDILQSDRDLKKAALLADLAYTNDRAPGINRIYRGKEVRYYFKNKLVKDKNQIDRIRKLAIPPAWTRVWICPQANGHIQATGRDLRERKQYRYHARWNSLREETKFHRLYEFGKSLPKIRNQLDRDITSNRLNKEKVLATLIRLMEKTYIRIGNTEYEKENGSYGLTTLQDKHIDIRKDQLCFSFKGKSGIHHKISLRNKKLAKIVKQCRDIPGKELFQYYNEEGNRKTIDSGMVNQYIQSCSGGNFTAKDFRTWAGTIQTLLAIQSNQETSDETNDRKTINTILDFVSSKLGNSRAICKKYYIHPLLLKLYEEKNIKKYLNGVHKEKDSEQNTGLTLTERKLMNILADHLNGQEQSK